MAEFELAQIVGGVVGVVGRVLESVDQPAAAAHLTAASPVISAAIDVAESGLVDVSHLSVTIADAIVVSLREEREAEAATIVALLIPIIQHVISKFVKVEIRGAEIIGVIDFTE